MQVEPVLRNMHRSSIIVNSLHCYRIINVVKNWMVIVIDRLMRLVSLRYSFLRICATIRFPLKVLDVINIVSILLLILENLILLLLILLLLLLLVEHS